MDVKFYFTFLTIVTFLENDILVKASTCNTSPPSTAKCDEQLNVTNGQACFFGTSQTMASISCSPSYTFNTHTTFTCTHYRNQKTWTPTSEAICLSTASIPSTTFTSKLLPSESTLFSSVISPGTPSLTTITMMTSTGLRTSASPPTTSLGQTAISSTIMTATSILVTQDPSASLKFKDSDINAAYIVVPVVICVIALLLGVGILWWRRRTQKPSSLFERSEPGSLITNQEYEANGIDRNCSLMNVRQSTVNEYAEIPLDIMNSGDTIGDTYQTIDILPEDKADVKKSYDNFKLSETEFIDTNYSHIGLNNTRNNNHADNTYSHTQLENGQQKPEITVSGDDTYNKLNSATLPERRCQDTENSDTEYSHAHARGHDPENEADNYSHLNTNMRTPGTSTEKPKHQFEDGMTNKNSNIRLLSAKDLSSNTGYEFAKDFDNLQNRSEAPEYAKVTKKKPAFNEAHIAGKGYETAVGTTHNYLILEPDTNPAPTSTLFKVVEDVSAETDEMPEAETGHEYFTLEKQDI